jgi:hypothetical protein
MSGQSAWLSKAEAISKAKGAEKMISGSSSKKKESMHMSKMDMPMKKSKKGSM